MSCPWLPPLNVPGRPSQTTVKIWQSGPNGSDQTLQYPFLYRLKLNAFVDFVSDSNNPSTRQKKFPGLAVCQKNLHTTCVCWVVNDILRCLPSINSDQNQVLFSERLLHEEEFKSSLSGSSADQLYPKIASFMHNVAKLGLEHDINNNVSFLELDIRMEIVTPDDELKSWHSWYDAKIKSDPYFNLVYVLAINRPRTEEELLAEDVKARRSGSSRFEVVEVEETSEESCLICLEEFLVGCKVNKLPCGHMFHDNCITKWLADNSVCPMCRSDIQSSLQVDDELVKK